MRTRLHHLCLLVLMTLAGLPLPAAAQTVSIRACGLLATSFLDVGGSDDFYTTNVAFPGRIAYGVAMQIQQNGVNAWPVGGGADYTDWSGTDPGCTPYFNVTSGVPVTITMYSAADVRGNEIRVWDDSNTPALLTATRVVTPFFGGTTHNVEAPAVDVSNILAAATWAMQRRSTGVTGETFDFFDEACPGTGANCFQSSTERIFISSGQRKHIIVHEMGHAMAYFANGGVSANDSMTKTSLYCISSSTGSHGVDSEEWQSGAVNEGIADYYSSVAFNDTSQSNCWRAVAYNVDWDDDGVSEGREYSCEGAPPSSMSPIPFDARDLWAEICDDPLDDDEGLGTQYDWNRHFWDLDTDEGLSTSDIFAIWEGADPDLWTASGHGFSAGYASYELYISASLLGFGTEWTNQWDNGPWR